MCILAVDVDIDIESFVSQPKAVVTLFNERRFGQRLCSAVGHLVSRFDPSERYTFFVNALPYPIQAVSTDMLMQHAKRACKPAGIGTGLCYFACAE